MGTDLITVILVDDHAIVRQGLRALLERERDIEVVGEASEPQSAMRLLEALSPDVAVLDLKLSAGSDAEGLALCSQIVASQPQVAVLILTTFLDDQLILDAISRGAKGYVVKDVDTSSVVSAIRDLKAGGSFFDPRSSTAIVRGLHATEEPRSHELTGREREVLHLLALGRSNKQIGEELFISAATAKFHVGNIMRKLGSTRRAEAVYAAGKLGLV